MKKFKAAVFDMDGTLLDTMYIWQNMTREYLMRNNIEIPVEMNDKFRAMGIASAADFLISNFHLDIAAEKVHEELVEILAEYYRDRSEFKPGAEKFLKELQSRGIRTVILSATPKHLLHLALGKLNAEKYFTHGLISCTDINLPKYQPEAFFTAVEHLQVPADEVIVFEDAWYAASTAKNAGFTLGIMADSIEKKTEEMREIADFYIEENWDEFPVDRFF